MKSYEPNLIHLALMLLIMAFGLPAIYLWGLHLVYVTYLGVNIIRVRRRIKRELAELEEFARRLDRLTRA